MRSEVARLSDFYKESKFKNKDNIFSFINIFYFILLLFFWWGGGGREKGWPEGLSK